MLCWQSHDNPLATSPRERPEYGAGTAARQLSYVVGNANFQGVVRALCYCADLDASDLRSSAIAALAWSTCGRRLRHRRVMGSTSPDRPGILRAGSARFAVWARSFRNRVRGGPKEATA